MMKIRLQNIRFPEAGICDTEELYFHKNGNTVDFDGYFNLFYIEKRKAYTNIDGVSLSLELQGYKTITLYHDHEKLREISLVSPGTSLRKYTFDFPWAEYDTGVFWFALEKENAEICPAGTVTGFFQGHINPENIRDVNIAIDICTYRRETYIERNLGALSRRFFAQKANGQAEQIKQTEQTEKTGNAAFDIGQHLWVYVIDNGQTLDRNKEIQDIVRASQGRIRIFPNKNTGGAGGFTRGMLEVLDDRKPLGLTHVLLMDDDAVFDPDAFVRVYGLLCTLKEEWRGITIGGEMLREECPCILYCAGERWRDGRITDTAADLDIRDFANATCRYLTGVGHEYDRYSGWWCCCYSLGTVRGDNLPLPLFLHYDDIEFGLRNQDQGVIFLNGVGVWHRGPDVSFPGANLYYDIRNDLIQTALCREGPSRHAARKLIFKIFALSLARMKYKDAELSYRGLMDFLKGPAWLWRQDPEALNTSIRAMGYSMQPVEHLLQPPDVSSLKAKNEDTGTGLTPAEYMSATEQIRHIQENGSMKAILATRRTGKREKLLSWITLTGWFLPLSRRGVTVISSTDSRYPPFPKRKIVLYDVGNSMSCLITKDWRLSIKTVLLYVRAACALEKGFNAAAESWRKNAGQLGNAAAWRKYLKGESSVTRTGATTGFMYHL